MWSSILASNLWRLWLAAGSAFVVTLAFTPVVRRVALHIGCVDRPSGERWAKRVVARLGGVAMFAGYLVAISVWVSLNRTMVGLLCASLLIFLLGIVDDLRRLQPYTKLLWQLVVGCVLVMFGIRIELIPWTWLSVPLSIFWFVLIMNAFNLLDNMDGLAAGIGAIAAGFCAVHAATTGQWTIAGMASILSGTCVGFLWNNFPPAKIYMGDSGSHLLGLNLAALALLGTWRHSTQLLTIMAIPVLVLAVPIFDTCFVTIQRLVNRTHPFRGGKDHVSHRLAILGLSQRQTVLVLYVVSAVFGMVSLLSVRVGGLPAIVIAFLVVAVVALAGAYLAKVKVYEVRSRGSLVGASVEDGDRPATFINTMLLHKRRLLEVVLDFSLIGSAYVAAHLLRFEATLTGDLQRLIVRSLPLILIVKLSCFVGVGLYRGVWRYVGLADLVTIFKGATLGSIGSAIALLYLWRFEGFSRAVFIIDWLLLFVTVSGSRVAERFVNEWIISSAEGAVPALIIGAGDTGELALRQMKQNGQWKRRVVGFLDDDVRKQGARIHGRVVLGTRKALPDVLQVYGVQEVFIAMGKPPAELVEQVRRTCETQGVRWRLVSAMMPTLDGND